MSKELFQQPVTTDATEKIEVANSNIAVANPPSPPVRVDRRVKLTVNPRNNEYHVEPIEMRSNRRKIGSEILMVNGKATNSFIRGLSAVQELTFLPRQLGLQPTDSGWQRKLEEYWKDFTIIVEGESSLDASFTMGTGTDGNGNLVEMEIPDNLGDYMKFSFAIQSSRIAKNEMERSNASNYEVFMIDLESEKRLESAQFEIEAEAIKAFSELLMSGDSANDKIDWLISKLKDPKDNYVGVSIKEKLMALRTIMTKTPKEFLEEFNNKNLQYEALAYKLIQNRIVLVEGELHFFGDENLGKFRPFVEALKDQTKSSLLLKLREQLRLSEQKYRKN